ncbi:3-oxoacyl- [Neofusicoccum parvum]|nr:3-oxoacyl- [Neofusicoccum parvum]
MGFSMLHRTALSRAIPSRPALRHAAATPAPRCTAATPPRQHTYHTNALLTGHHALVTGGSRGIGKAIATRFASLNASTTIVGRNAETLRLAVQEIAAAAPSTSSASPPPTHGFVTGDISTKGFWEMLTRSLLLRTTLAPSPAPSPPATHHHHHHHHLGSLEGGWEEDAEAPSSDPEAPPEPDAGSDGWHRAALDPAPTTVLVNAAGVTHNALLVRQSAARAEDVVQTNLMGTVWGCKVLGKLLLGAARRRRAAAGAGGGVSIVNVSSLLAVQGGVGSAAYAASKAGVLAMQPEAREKALERIPLKRFGTVEEIADAAVFLTTNQYANNCVINLDGGMSAVSIVVVFSFRSR